MENLAVIVGTRGSPLALAQTEIVVKLLEKKNRKPKLDFQIRKMKTEGDELSRPSKPDSTGKDSFTRLIDRALEDGKIDVAVHSLKDVPVATFGSEKIEIAAIPKRDSPYDVLVAKNGTGSLSTLPKGAKIGTSSVRRALQLLAFRPDFQIVEIRGNVQTRLSKLNSSNLDAIVLARAGLNRLKIDSGRLIPGSTMLPAPGQGALAVTIRKNDPRMKSIVSKIDDMDARLCIAAEFAFATELGGGCNLPVAALARIEKSSPQKLVLEGLVERAKSAGTLVARSKISGRPKEGQSLGRELALRLKKFTKGE